jgi:hypothetical protein
LPYLKAAQVDTLTLPSDPAYTVQMKSRASYGDVESARSAMLKITPTATGTNTPTMEWKAYIVPLTLSLIVDWNLTDENEVQLPITALSLGKLDPVDGDFLSSEAQKRSELRPEVREIPFVKASTDS